MIGRIPETQFDLRFRVGPIPVRVHPIFWATAAFLAWDGSDPPKTFLGVLCVFLSILVHELGHATMTRKFGWPSEIVLGAFGGYATTARTTTFRNLVVLFAGPCAGFLLAGTAILCVVGFGEMPQRATQALGFLVFINVGWSLLNLVPVLPMDGGQIAREILVWVNPHQGEQRAMLFSAVVGAIAAVGGYLFGPYVGLDGTFLAIIFGLFAYQNFSGWQMRRRGGWS